MNDKKDNVDIAIDNINNAFNLSIIKLAISLPIGISF